MSEQIETKSQGKSWLSRLKEESWEAELLVSAVAIFAILKSFSAIDWLVIKFIDNLDPSQYLIGYAVVVSGYLAIGVLACMFIIHFALRAYWIGLVGLNSVFPDYSLEDSAYSPIYTEKLLKILPKLPKTITKVDELCSVIFSAAFSLMMVYFYFTLVATLYLILFNLLKDHIPYWILLIPAYFLGLVFMIGVLISIPANMKRNHQKERLQHVFFIYSSFGNKLLYGPLYKSIMQIFMIFGSNFKKKKSLVRLVIVMCLAGACFGAIRMGQSNFGYLIVGLENNDVTRIENSFYATTNTSEFLLTPEIQSDVIDSKSIKLFIPIMEHEIRRLSEVCDLQEYPKFKKLPDDELQQKRQEYLDCYHKKHVIKIDKKIIPVEFMKADHPLTQQFGIITYMDTADMKKGKHTLQVEKTLSDTKKLKWKIPFFIVETR